MSCSPLAAEQSKAPEPGDNGGQQRKAKSAAITPNFNTHLATSEEAPYQRNEQEQPIMFYTQPQ